MKTREEVELERDAARLEAFCALKEVRERAMGDQHLQRGAMAGYANAAMNVWQDKLDEWEEAMR